MLIRNQKDFLARQKAIREAAETKLPALPPGSTDMVHPLSLEQRIANFAAEVNRIANLRGIKL